MRLARDRARVRVPATSGNLGPGFDCMGMAHDLWDEVEVRMTTGPTRVDIEGEGAGILPRDGSHLVLVALRRALDVAGVAYSGFELKATNGIFQGRGLGSSAAAVVAGLIVLAAFCVRAIMGGWNFYPSMAGTSDIIALVPAALLYILPFAVLAVERIRWELLP